MKAKNSVVRARIDADLKVRATRILSERGLEMSDAIRMFLQQVVLQEAIPFPIDAMRQMEQSPAADLWKMKAAAQARDHGIGHEMRDDLLGEKRLSLRSNLVKGAHVRSWPWGKWMSVLTKSL